MYKPTPIPFFNNPSRFKILDIAAGDDHSFVHVQETNVDGTLRYRVYEIGNSASADDQPALHRIVSQDDLLLGQGIAPAASLDNHVVVAMACGHRTSFF